MVESPILETRATISYLLLNRQRFSRHFVGTLLPPHELHLDLVSHHLFDGVRQRWVVHLREEDHVLDARLQSESSWNSLKELFSRLKPVSKWSNIISRYFKEAFKKSPTLAEY